MKEILSISRAARELNIHESTLRRWTTEGTLPFRKMGGRRFLLRSDLEQLITRKK